MSEEAFDELLRRLSEAGVEFVLIGGLAVNAWGVVRGTKDVGVVVAPDPENLKRVAEAAVAAGGHVQKGEAPLGSPPSIAAAPASGEQVAIETDLEGGMALDRESVGGGRYAVDMAEEVHVTLSGGLRGRYVLERKLAGGRVVLAPETSAEAILARLGHEPATLAEFEAEHGPVRPADGEG